MAKVEQEKLAPPQHIAIIMDGNGRWAKKRGLPRTAGHAAGAEAFRRVAHHCRDIGVKYLTVYAFSTENWKRSADEVSGIMKLLAKGLNEVLSDLQKDRMHVSFWGDMSRISPELQELCRKTEAATKDFDVQVNFCLNYGGRDELVKAAAAFARDVADGTRKPEELTEDLFGSYLYSHDIPDPELIIRPSGEQRISNFLLWQSAYSEFVFMDVLWPDFGPDDLDKAIAQYQNRDRRFGGA